MNDFNQSTLATSVEGDSLRNGPGQVFILTFLAVHGTLGNILIIMAVVTDKRLRSYTDAFIVNVAVKDLLVTSFVIPSMIPLLLAGENIYPHALCQVSVFAGGNIYPYTLCKHYCQDSAILW